MIVLIILLVCLVLFYRLRITIDAETLCASFGIGVIRKRVRLAEIVACEPIRIRWWHGWGIHLTPLRLALQCFRLRRCRDHIAR